MSSDGENQPAYFARLEQASSDHSLKEKAVNSEAAEVADVPKHPQLRFTPKWLKWVTSFVTLVTGVLSTYSFKVMNRVAVPPCDGCEARFFEGSFIQALLMFVGEFLNLIVWWLDEFFSKRANKFPVFEFVRDPVEGMKPRPKNVWWYWAFPPFMDMCATIMMAIAMQITFASTVQMLRNFMVCITCLSQVLIVRKAPTVHQYVGVVVITVAMVLSAIPAVTNPEESTNSTGTGKAALGVVLALVGTSIQGVQLSYEDYLMRKTKIPPSFAIGLEGAFGLVYTVIAMPIGDVSGLEKVWESFYQARQSGTIIGWIVGYIFIACAFNIFGLSTTFLASGLLRSIIFALRAPVVWIVDLCLKWVEYGHYNLASVLVFCVGFSFYCRMYELPGRLGKFWRKPVHCGNFTKRELDDDYVPPPAGDNEEDADRQVV